jgi:Flp pilus assembly protein TadG
VKPGRARRAHGRGPAGQALVEFALIVPILLLLVLAIVDFGRAWNVYQVLTDAAREGGRVAVVANPSTTIDSVAAKINTLLDAAGLDTASATKTVTGFRAGTGTPATVSISYPYVLRWLTPFMGWTAAQSSFTLNTRVVFRNE